MTLEEVIDDLCFRFILNCPAEELTSFERLCFQVELAHWFYEDYYREADPRLPAMSLSSFARRLFQQCEVLRPHEQHLHQILQDFRQYKSRVPTYGAILVSSDQQRVLLVKGYGKGGWGFPKGKVNKDESEFACAAREVREETGFDMLAPPPGVSVREDLFLEAYLGEQKVRLYIVEGVPDDFPFQPTTKREIAKVRWHAVDGLPSSRDGPGLQKRRANRYYTVIPFVARLRCHLRSRRSAFANPRRGPPHPAPAAAVSAPAPAAPATAEPAEAPGGGWLDSAPVVERPSEAARLRAEQAIKSLLMRAPDAAPTTTSSSFAAVPLSSHTGMRMQQPLHAVSAPTLPAPASTLSQAASLQPSASSQPLAAWPGFRFNVAEIMQYAFPKSA